jgi:colanic acid/amylovoran biosynthesis protein
MDAKRESAAIPRKILLINLHSSWNAGDDALAQGALRQLSGQFPQASFVLAMNDPASYRGEGSAVESFTAWVRHAKDRDAPRWRWLAFPGLIVKSLLALVGYRLMGRPWLFLLTPEQRALLQAYFQADMVISSAGNFLYTSGRVGFPFLLALFSIRYAGLAGKPLYALPQTLGPLRRRRERLLAKKVLSKMRIVLVRDSISAEVWQTWDVQGPKWAVLPDVAFATFAEGGREEAVALLEEYGVQRGSCGPCLGVTLIHWGAQSRWFTHQARYESAVEAAVRAFLTSYGGCAVFFAQVHGPTLAEDDRVPARRVLAGLADLADQVALIDRWVPPHVLKAAYGQMDLFLGTRLHSNIFALTEGVPVVAIGYQYKTRGVMQMAGLEQWVLDIEQVSQDALVRLLHEAWAKRERTRARLQEVIPGLRDQASQAGTLIASDFLSLTSGSGGR